MQIKTTIRYNHNLQEWQKFNNGNDNTKSFPNGSGAKESTCNVGDTGDTDLIPGWGRSPEGRNGNPPQYSSLENPMDRGSWSATVHRTLFACHKESDTTEHAY